ncbi:uncharacterized protein BDR25DRAFT_379620 [Lindgomyces ingoldianus]|uniref:Uncharacterized protein n=1 Tax=Lindgomyces ingoldianus TaxID=673940 RepID=A0ACB6RBZ4_9PLEO|nr:uncharacterized protein BDR25DRAFT_379620 [Lindgomyces ingoldianus]KAF2475986.1 hypothetical protein BDR25DRAFT_379620 [Lindgomyces ingoldianus]
MANQSISQHERGFSFHVNYSSQEVAQLAQEIHEEKISEVHLSLFTFWICEKGHHYEEAKQHIRELALDQGYPTSRISNSFLRKLLEDTIHLRPRYAKPVPQTPGLLQGIHTRAVSEVTWSPRTPPQFYPDPKSPSASPSIKAVENPRSAPYFSMMSMGGMPLQRQRQTSTLDAPPLSSSAIAVTAQPFIPGSVPTLNPQPRTRAPNSPTPLRRASHRIGGAPTQNRVSATRAVSSPVPARPGLLHSPPSLIPEFPLPPTTGPMEMRGSLPSASPWNAEFPPDTPDRPAPLNIRSRTNSGVAQVQKDVLPPSVSTPTPMHQAPLSSSSPTMLSTHPNGTASSLCTEDEMGGITQDDGASSWRLSTVSSFNYIISGSTRTNTIAPVEEDASTSFHSSTELPSETSTRVETESEAEPEMISTPIANTSSNISHQDYTAVSDPLDRYVTVTPYGRVWGFIPGPVPTSAERRAAVQARRQAQLQGAPVSGLHRPLPLRSFDNESIRGHSYWSSSSSANLRSTSDPDPSRGHPLPRGTLTGLSNRIGPSILTRMASRPVLPASEALAPNAAYRSATSEHIRGLLQQTRARGAQLGSVNRSSLSAFEVAWRNSNEALIVAIYGRSDVVLGNEDVEF